MCYYIKSRDINIESIFSKIKKKHERGKISIVMSSLPVLAIHGIHFEHKL